MCESTVIVQILLSFRIIIFYIFFFVMLVKLRHTYIYILDYILISIKHNWLSGKYELLFCVQHLNAQYHYSYSKSCIMMGWRHIFSIPALYFLFNILIRLIFWLHVWLRINTIYYQQTERENSSVNLVIQHTQ